jgi:hypothetical protein
MSKTQTRRLFWRLFTLSLLLSGMVFLTLAPGARAGDPVEHESCCIDRYNTCNAQCPPVCDASGCYSDIACVRNCDKQYYECTTWGGGGCYIPPEEPCPGCAESCDVMQQECIDSGGDPRSCVAAGVRCRQSCYVGCPQ